MAHLYFDHSGCVVRGGFGGGYAAARFTGSDWREAASLGVLLNTRGLMELIVLNMGLDLGVLSPTLFTMFVLMAVTTTLATTPVLQRIVRFDSSSEATVERASATTFRWVAASTHWCTGIARIGEEFTDRRTVNLRLPHFGASSISSAISLTTV